MLAAWTAQAREEQEAPQQQAPPDMRTSQSAKACLCRVVPTDHEARGQAQRRQLRRVATELRRDHDLEAGAKHAKQGRIRTQIGYLSRMTSVRGKQNDLHAQRLEGTQVVLVSPADHPAQRCAREASCAALAAVPVPLPFPLSHRQKDHGKPVRLRQQRG